MVWHTRRRQAAGITAVIAVLALVAGACGDDDGGEETGAGGAIEITLQEFAVLPSPDSAPAGEVTFNVTNIGPEDVHEFVVFATDLAPDALPTAPDGSVDETGEGVELIDEIEDIAVDETPTLTVTLDAGSYVLICNIVEEEGADTIVHYQQGMRVGFTAE
jgi:uncharacterized cupredoxin-like copper-binding protein